jgi:hypothetical protein
MIRPVSQFAPRGDCQFGFATRWSARINASYFYYSIIGLRSNKKVLYFLNRAMTLLSNYYSNKNPKINLKNTKLKLTKTQWCGFTVFQTEPKYKAGACSTCPRLVVHRVFELEDRGGVVPSFNSRVNNWQVPAHARSVCQVNL